MHLRQSTPSSTRPLGWLLWFALWVGADGIFRLSPLTFGEQRSVFFQKHIWLMSSRKVCVCVQIVCTRACVHVCAPAWVSGAHRTEWRACSLINKHIKHIWCGWSEARHQKWESLTFCSFGWGFYLLANTFIDI